MALNHITRSEIYDVRLENPNRSTKHEARCLSPECTGDKLGTSELGMQGILVKPTEDDLCPNCGDSIVWKVV